MNYILGLVYLIFGTLIILALLSIGKHVGNMFSNNHDKFGVECDQEGVPKCDE